MEIVLDVQIVIRKRKKNSFAVKSSKKVWLNQKNFVPLHSQKRNGTLADRLGNGLQNRVEQFDSARYLKTSVHKSGSFLFPK